MSQSRNAASMRDCQPYNGRLFLARHNTSPDPDKIGKMLGKAADNLNRKYDKDEIAKILAREKPADRPIFYKRHPGNFRHLNYFVSQREKK